jgi:hypothetical protein
MLKYVALTPIQNKGTTLCLFEYECVYNHMMSMMTQCIATLHDVCMLLHTLKTHRGVGHDNEVM